MVDVLGLQDSKQMAAAVERLSVGLSALSDVYMASTFRLPAKLGGVLLGVYSKQDNRKYLEVAVMGKISKGLMESTTFHTFIDNSCRDTQRSFLPHLVLSLYRPP